MPPSVALALWFILLIALLRFDPARTSVVSAALWVPVAEFFIIGSRLPSQWLGIGNLAIGSQAMQEGNALDRVVYIALIVIAATVLAYRSFSWMGFCARNRALVALLGFALVSVIWSDYPFVSFKRWFRDLAYYLTTLVVLTDPKPLEAIRTVFRRSCYLLVPLSVLVIKYFPAVGRQYERWAGEVMYVGATTSKNMLGLLCLVSGIYFVWDTMTRWPGRAQRQVRLILLVNFAFIVMTLWLLNLANSATSNLCLLLGCLVLAAFHIEPIKRRPALVLVSIPAVFLLYCFVAFGLGFDLNALIATAVGRDPTLTGRTRIWETLLSVNTNALVGTGYEAFWIGPRLEWIWQRAGHINEAHNGYLEIYLSVGLLGLALIAAFFIGAYQTIWTLVKAGSRRGYLAMALWTVMLFYNMSEAAMPNGFLWLSLLATVVSVPEPRPVNVPVPAVAPAFRHRQIRAAPAPGGGRLRS
jgi:O-antigen ligase